MDNKTPSSFLARASSVTVTSAHKEFTDLDLWKKEAAEAGFVVKKGTKTKTMQRYTAHLPSGTIVGYFNDFADATNSGGQLKL